MRTSAILRTLILALVCSVSQAAGPITGTVTDEGGKTLNGVFVSARRGGANSTVTVYSNDSGRFEFPENLSPGTYTVRAHAGGLQTGERSNVVVTNSGAVNVDFALKAETRPEELFRQATPGEWLASLPGTEYEKRSVVRHCSGCHHSLYQIKAHRFDKEGWLRIIETMELIDAIGVPRTVEGAGAGDLPQQVIAPGQWHFASREEIADYLAKIRGPQTPWPTIRFHPRPSGKATQAAITEFHLPRENAAPHDVVLDSKGNAWYNDFKSEHLGVINRQTGEIKEYKLPRKAGVPPGSSNMFMGDDDTVWVNQRIAGQLFRFDPKTEKVIGTWERVSFNRFDSKAGVAYGTNMQMDVATGRITRYRYKDSTAGYGSDVDSRGFGYRGGIKDSDIKVLNPETGDVTRYPTPTPDSGPRRITLDGDEFLWFGEWLGGNVGKLDIKAGKITEYRVSVPHAAFYEAGVDPKSHHGWAFDWHNDRLVRVNPATSEVIEYPMPTPDVESRRTAVDTSTDPSSVWIHGAGNGTIIRVQAP
jgi:virginiamycin B lyase